MVLYQPALERFRIQQRPYKPGVLRLRLPLIGLNLAIFYALNAVALYLLRDWFRIGEPPPLGTLLLQFAIILVIDDTYFYFYHRLLHNRFLMKKIHGIHHRAVMPFPLEYIYVHPLEWSVGALGPFLAILAQGGVSAWTLWAYTVWRSLREITIHSGTRSWILHRIPLVGTTEHHDLHHSKVAGNYGSTLKIWDKLLGTELRSET